MRKVVVVKYGEIERIGVLEREERGVRPIGVVCSKAIIMFQMFLKVLVVSWWEVG